MNFIINLFKYLVIININAITTLWYVLSKNWFVLASLVLIVIFVYFEIKIKSEDIIYDEREMF